MNATTAAAVWLTADQLAEYWGLTTTAAIWDAAREGMPYRYRGKGACDLAKQGNRSLVRFHRAAVDAWDLERMRRNSAPADAPPTPPPGLAAAHDGVIRGGRRAKGAKKR